MNERGKQPKFFPRSLGGKIRAQQKANYAKQRKEKKKEGRHREKVGNINVGGLAAWSRLEREGGATGNERGFWAYFRRFGSHGI